MALLASGVVIFGIVERPEPVFVTPVSCLDTVQRAAVSAVARRAAELVERMPLQELRVRMAAERRVVIFLEAKIGFGERQRRGNVFRVHANVARLATVGEANAADVVDFMARRVDVDLNQRNVHGLDGVEQALKLRGIQAGKLVAGILRHGVLRIFHRLINVALFRGELRFLVEQLIEGIVELVIVQLLFDRCAVSLGPIDRVGLRFRFLHRLEFALLLAAVGGSVWNDFVVVNQRANEAAIFLERRQHGGALLVDESDLLLDGGVLRLGGSLGLLERGGKFLIVRRRVDGFFRGTTIAKLFLQIDRIGRCETVLV